MTIIKKIFSGYAKLIMGLLPYMTLIAGLFAVSFLISLVLWYSSTTFTDIYSIIVIILIISSSVIFVAGKIVKEKLFGRIFNFIGIILEFFFIMYLYAQKMNMIIPAIALSVEYLIFLGMTLGLDGFLDSWMKTILIVLTLGGFIYSSALLFKSGMLTIAVPLSIFFFLAFGYILNERKKRSDRMQRE
jgi:hypothetical protein